MKIYSLKDKKYNILVKFCENLFQDIDINILIIDSKLDNSYATPFNIIELNSIITIPYISQTSLIIKGLKIIDFNYKDGEFVNSRENLKLDITTYKIFKLENYKSIIDYIDVQTGKIVGSAFSYKIINGILTIITTIELFLLNKIELEKKYKLIFECIISEYKELIDLDLKSKDINDKLKIEYIFNGNPLPILISQFEENQIRKKEFWSRWEKLENLTNLFSKKVLISTIKKLKHLDFLKEQDDFYIFKPLVIKLSNKYRKFGVKLLGN